MFDIDLNELGVELPEDKAAALKEALAAKGKEAIDTAVSGLKAKNQELLGTIKSTKMELDQLKGQFDGLDVEAVKGLLNRASQDEETRLLAEGKIDEVFNRRTERLQAETAKQIKAEQEARERAEAKAAKLGERAIASAIQSAAVKAGALPEAIDDIVLRSKSLFTLNDDGEVVAVKDGEVVLGKDGKTPLTPHEWAASLQEAAPHLWPRAQGTDAPGSKGAQGKSMTRAAFDALPPADKAKVATGGYTITD